MPDLSKIEALSESLTDEEFAALNRQRMLTKPVLVVQSPAFNGKKMGKLEGGGAGWKPIGVGHLRHDGEFYYTHWLSIKDQLDALGL